MLISSLPMLYVIFGVFMVMGGFAAPNAPGQSEPGMGQMVPFFAIGGVFITIGGVLVLIGFTLAICIILAGRRMMRKRRYGFCLTMAAIECLFMPFGTILGILTIFLLANHDIKGSFMGNDEII